MGFGSGREGRPGRVSWDILSRPWRDFSIGSGLTQDYVLGYSQPSLAGLVLTGAELTRTGVLGYFQPSPSTSSGQALRDLVPIQRDS